MKITKVYFNAFDGGNTKGYASFTFEDMLVVKGFKLMDGANGLFLSPPAKQGKDGEWRDEVYATKPELKEAMLNAVLEEAGIEQGEDSPF